MSESSAAIASIRHDLEAWSRRLRGAAAADPDAAVDPADQLEVENAIAAGVAVLASEPLPSLATEPSARPILARDLAITADLVARAIKAFED